MEANNIYNVTETRTNFRKIMSDVSQGIITETRNKTTNEEMFMVNNKIFLTMLSLVKTENEEEYDKEQNAYTVYNTTIPQLYGEGITKKEAYENMVVQTIEFLEDYRENISLYSNVFNGLQQFVIGNLLLNQNKIDKIKEILNIG